MHDIAGRVLPLVMRHHARLQVTIAGGKDHELAHHLPASLTEAAEQLPIVEKVRA